MPVAGLLAALIVCIGIVALIARRHHTHDDFAPSVRDYAAFRSALAAVEQTDQVHA